MGVYTCTKPATFAGVKYMPGDTVPAEAIPANRVSAVIRLGLIAEAQPAAANQAAPAEPPAPTEPPAPQTFTVPIKMEDGTESDLEITMEAVAEAIAVLQMSAEGAVDRIKAIADGAALIVIDACDSRKTVKKAAAARAAELDGEPGTEEPGTPAEPGAPAEPPASEEHGTDTSGEGD